MVYSVDRLTSRCLALLSSVCVFSFSSLWAQTFAGSKTCAPCHPQQSRAHSRSGHAQALFPIDQHPLRSKWPAQFQLTSEGRTLRWNAAETSDGSESAIAEWAFGSGRKGVTFVGSAPNDSLLEHSLTYYPSAGKFGLTPGHEKREPAVGQLISKRSSCFPCHTTNANERGVGCEACHGPGANHAASKQEMRTLTKLNGDEVNALCGRCHRPASGDEFQNDFRDPWNVRHQPPYLEQSRCFQESDGRLTCVSCHPPHDGIPGSFTARVNQVCAGCHNSKLPAACANACVQCHMPKVQASQWLDFRNHWIGIYGSNPLVPGLN